MLWGRGAIGGESLAEVSRDRLEYISSTHRVTAVIFVPAGNFMVCLERVSTPFAPTLIPAGESRPLNIIATGGVFLIPPEKLEDTKSLMRELKKDLSADPKAAGIKVIIKNFKKESVFDDGGCIYPGTHRLGVPIYHNNEIIAVLGTGAPSESFAQKGFREHLLKDLKKAAADISRDMSILR
jgi:DNA-binding IclR family transcriptional regulator